MLIVCISLFQLQKMIVLELLLGGDLHHALLALSTKLVQR